jgi:hypothetical protein
MAVAKRPCSVRLGEAKTIKVDSFLPGTSWPPTPSPVTSPLRGPQQPCDVWNKTTFRPRA